MAGHLIALREVVASFSNEVVIDFYGWLFDEDCTGYAIETVRECLAESADSADITPGDLRNYLDRTKAFLEDRRKAC